MLFKKEVYLLVAPSLIWGQVLKIQPGEIPEELFNCMHLARVPINMDLQCLKRYTCRGGGQHVCLLMRPGQVQRCTYCGDEAEPQYFEGCLYGTHTDINCIEHQ
ncbi:hypothetical protein PGT21_018540 [Puccinia graminis f. sp. tritici]|uniref:Uncharacterized protein n=1 Tax=Puccinia graminis f. sp. tritici TaxID=56615 RepID=A0A5B0RGQ7_PUCGR|nr:hypothetical protein PGT21_018540 [Puccinia graminis f. sp. tritici]KAA1124632.1 hypothetical protein PGTUg99_024922 [Puccinia graminis f. sp. tritici]